MKKKLALVLSMIFLVFGLAACGTKDQTNMDFNGKSYSDLQNDMILNLVSVYYLSDYATAYATETGTEITDDTIYDALTAYGITDDYYASSGMTFNEVQKSAAGKLANIRKNYGEITDIGDLNIKVTVSGNTTTVDYVIPLSNDSGSKDVTFELVYKTWNMEITGFSIDPVQTMGEKLANAGMNTLISICIVFAVLILISLIIYAFNIFPYIEKKKKEKAARVAAQTPAIAAEETQAVETITTVVNEADDLELVAVIAAAIAASEGCSTSDFVVRSINRR